MEHLSDEAIMPNDSDTKSSPQDGDLSHYDLPDAKTVEEAGELDVLDKDGKKIRFKSLYAEQGKKHVIIFIRHFFCGVSRQKICRE